MNKYKVLSKFDGEDDDFIVGYGFDEDFEPIKSFKHWDEAFEFYLKLFYEKPFNSKKLVILDLIHKEYHWLDIRREPANI